jgi:hypothetical protein
MATNGSVGIAHIKQECETAIQEIDEASKEDLLGILAKITKGQLQLKVLEIAQIEERMKDAKGTMIDFAKELAKLAIVAGMAAGGTGYIT